MLYGENIHKSYRHASSELHVLKGVHFSVKTGDVVAIVGPSGAGKSTLLHILGGLDQPSQGRVIFKDQDLYRLRDQKRSQICNQEIGFIFQFYHLLPEFTALENVMLPALVRNGNHVREVRARSRELLDRVGLAQRDRHKPSELSGGEQQRVAIARALINKPSIIFCDEPTGNLDSENGKIVLDLLFELNVQYRQALVIVTHDERIAQRSPRTVHMRDGQFID